MNLYVIRFFSHNELILLNLTKIIIITIIIMTQFTVSVYQIKYKK